MNKQVNRHQINRRDFLGRSAGGLAFAFTLAGAPLPYAGEAQAAGTRNALAALDAGGEVPKPEAPAPPTAPAPAAAPPVPAAALAPPATTAAPTTTPLTTSTK